MSTQPAPAPRARETILAAVRNALPKPPVDLPRVPRGFEENSATGGVGYGHDLTALEEVRDFPKPGEPLAPYFERHLKAMGGQSFTVPDLAAAEAKLRELFPDARQTCSDTPELKASRPIAPGDDPHSFHDIDVAMVRSRLGVAEAGAVWLSEADLVVPSLGVLAQHIVVLLDPSAIVPTLHEAYNGSVSLWEGAYGVFMAGPSATGDIEGVIIHGAQGARSLTVLLVSASDGSLSSSRKNSK